MSILQSPDDESLMRSTVLKCYGTKVKGFRVSTDHYRYLVEQIISLREQFKRNGLGSSGDARNRDNPAVLGDCKGGIESVPGPSSQANPGSEP